MFGMQIIDVIDEEEYSNFVSKCSDSELNIHFIKTDSIDISSVSQWGLSIEYRNLLLQPMQAFLFDGDSLLFFVANCLVPPKLPNLNWNHQNKFDYFPPKNTINIDSLNLRLSKLKYIDRRKYSEVPFRYTYVVNWNLFSGRQSMRLIEMVKYNIKHFKLSDSTLLILNNTDDILIKSDLNH